MKINQFPVDNDKFNCKKDEHKHTVGVFRIDGTLVGYTPIELSNLIDYFLRDAEKNFASAAAVVPRKR